MRLLLDLFCEAGGARTGYAQAGFRVVGNLPDVARARRDLELPWLTRDELREAVPPRYTRFLGRQLLRFVLDRDGPPRRVTGNECDEPCHVT